MMPVSGSVSMSSCLKCAQVVSLADQLTKSMHEFEIFTMEMEFDPESAKLKSQEVLSTFWQLISMIKSIKIVEKEEIGEEDSFPENPGSSTPFISVEKKHQVKIENEEIESETDSENESESGSEYEPSKSHQQKRNRQKRSSQKRKQNGNWSRNRNPIPTGRNGRRPDEARKANEFLRMIKCETGDGFYNLFECTDCSRQFNSLGNARRHVKHIHLNLGTRCPTCANPYFDLQTLNHHIPRCSKGEGRQVKSIKIRLEENRKNPVTVYVQPHKHQNGRRQQKTTTFQRSTRQFHGQRADKKRKVFDPLNVKVMNPCENFSLEKSLNVKVVMERLELELELEKNKSESEKIPSVSQTEKSDE